VDVGVVFWDFDGTLAWREMLWRGSLIAALDEVHAGHAITADMVRPGLRDGFPWHRSDVSHRHLDTAQRWWADLRPLLVGAYQQAGVTQETAEAAAALVPRTYLDPRFWSVFPDSRPVLAGLREAGWRHVILSNHVPELPRLVADLGLDDLVEDVITSAETGYEKPHPEMFAVALRRSGSPARAWMVGDNPVADVAGAEAAGLPAILVRQHPSADLHAAAHTILTAGAVTSPGRSSSPRPPGSAGSA
jgi:HAD superfamily hydrolase (TIGR01509 family)